MSWVTCSLNDVLVKTENINPVSEPNRLFQYVDVSSVSRERLVITEAQNILGTDAPSRARKLIKTGDIIFATVRPTLRRVAIVPSNLNNEVCSTGYFVLRSNGKVLSKFIFYYLLRTEFMNEMEKLQTGASYPAVTDKQVKDQIISFPPLATQKKIVAKLDAIFAEIDKATAAAEANSKNAEALFSSYLNKVCNEDFVNAKKYKLSEVCSFHGGSQPAKSFFQYEANEDNLRFIQIRDYKSDKNIVYIPKNLARRFCDETDVMIGRYGPPVFQILRGIKGSYNVALMKAMPNEKLLNKDYLFYFLKNPIIQDYVISLSNRAAGQSGLNKETIEPYEIYLPTLKEQEISVSMIESCLEYSQKIINSCNTKIDSLSLLRQSILKQAFNGELVKD